MSTKVIKKKNRHLAHGDPKDEKPTNGRRDNQGRRNQAVEEEEEYDAANVPFSSPKESSLHMRMHIPRCAPLTPAQEAVGFVMVRVDASS
jgi:hypothetical protein